MKILASCEYCGCDYDPKLSDANAPDDFCSEACEYSFEQENEESE